ncbi:hypothetical protein [Pseudomonas helleri]|uniref:hypothetical protein n=1 Tax=Pseudomonas helleri TaxID=1608996 RepID=UPI0033408671
MEALRYLRSQGRFRLSFSGDIVETVSFFKEPAQLEQNLAAFNSLVSTMGKGSSIPSQSRNGRIDKWSGVRWDGIRAQPVVDFLRGYQTHPDSRKVRSDLLANFIEEMSRSGELTSWTVAIIGGGVTGTEDVAGFQVKRMKRINKSQEVDNKYSIGRLLSPQDEALDLDESSWNAALEWTRTDWKPDPSRSRGKELPEMPSGPYIRRVRGQGRGQVAPHPERGLLLMYLLDPVGSEVSGVDLPVVAFAISFPSSNAGKSVPYVVTNLMWEQQQ